MHTLLHFYFSLSFDKLCIIPVDIRCSPFIFTRKHLWYIDSGTHTHTELQAVPISKGKHGERNTAAAVCFMSSQQCAVLDCTVLFKVVWGENHCTTPHMDIFRVGFFSFHFSPWHCLCQSYTVCCDSDVNNIYLFWSISSVTLSVSHAFPLQQLIWFITGMIELVFLCATTKMSGMSDHKARHTHTLFCVNIYNSRMLNLGLFDVAGCLLKTCIIYWREFQKFTQLQRLHNGKGI